MNFFSQKEPFFNPNILLQINIKSGKFATLCANLLTLEKFHKSIVNNDYDISRYYAV